MRGRRTSHSGGSAHGQSVDHFTEPATSRATDTGAMAPAGQPWSTLGDLVRGSSSWPPDTPRAVARELARWARPPAGYGLGLMLLDADGGRLVGHNGSMPGFLVTLPWT